MNRHRKAEIIVLPVEVIEVVPPEILYIPGIDPAMRIWCLLNKHHGWQIIQIPIGRNLDKASVGTFFERLHPVVRVLAVVNITPFVSSAKEIGEAVVMGEAVVLGILR